MTTPGEIAAIQLRTWVKQSMAFTLMLKVRNDGKPTTTEHEQTIFNHAQDEAVRLLVRVGDASKFGQPFYWQCAVVEATVKWIDEHLKA